MNYLANGGGEDHYFYIQNPLRLRTDAIGSLGRFLAHALCAGQGKAAELGYGSLPPTLVRQALRGIAAIPGAPAHPQC